MSIVRGSSHKYTDVERSRVFREQNFKGEASNNQLDREDTSLQ